MNLFSFFFGLHPPPPLHSLLLRLQLGQPQPDLRELIQQVGSLLGQTFQSRRKFSSDGLTNVLSLKFESSINLLFVKKMESFSYQFQKYCYVFRLKNLKSSVQLFSTLKQILFLNFVCKVFK